MGDLLNSMRALINGEDTGEVLEALKILIIEMHGKLDVSVSMNTRKQTDAHPDGSLTHDTSNSIVKVGKAKDFRINSFQGDANHQDSDDDFSMASTNSNINDAGKHSTSLA